MSLRDRLGGEFIGSARPGALDLTVEGLPRGSYTLRFTGEDYSCDARFVIDGYSQYVKAGPGDGTFALGDSARRARIGAYVDELNTYVSTQGINSGNVLTRSLNVTEIAPTVLLMQGRGKTDGPGLPTSRG